MLALWQFSFASALRGPHSFVILAMDAPCFCPAATKEGYLPPWEVAKAFAFHTVLQDVAEFQGMQPSDLIGKRVDEYISERVTLKGGGHPSSRAGFHVDVQLRDFFGSAFGQALGKLPHLGPRPSQRPQGHSLERHR